MSPKGHPVSSRQRDPLGEAASSPTSWGGTQYLKSLLLSPYPAIPPYDVRTPHPGIADEREHIMSQNVSHQFHSAAAYMNPCM